MNTDQLPTPGSSGNFLTPEEVQVSSEAYTNYRNHSDQAIRIGIFGEDLEKALNNPDTLFLETKDNDGTLTKLPLLVPIDDLEWYNKELMKRTYGEDTRAFAYVHPPISDDEAQSRAVELIKSKVEEGHVVLTDVYSDDGSSPIAKVIQEAQAGSYSLEAFGGDTESRADVFAGAVVFNDEHKIVSAPSLYESYEQAVKNGEILFDDQNGTALASVIEGEEAERVWGIYEKPFEGLGENDPTYAGFDKESLLDILKDPEVAKIVNRANGEITTLCIFLQNFDKAPWFNKDYYKKHYPEYYQTNNVLMFPGIVSDENKRGNNYSADVINLTAQVLARRGSSVLVTFECTEVSTTYIPQLVTAAVNNTGISEISGLENPMSVINYFAIKKK